MNYFTNMQMADAFNPTEPPTPSEKACAAIRKHIKEAELDEVMNDNAVKSLADDLCFVVTAALTPTPSATTVKMK